jgi:hypothetical protein
LRNLDLSSAARGKRRYWKNFSGASSVFFGNFMDKPFDPGNLDDDVLKQREIRAKFLKN